MQPVSFQHRPERVLVVEDDEDTGLALEDYFALKGYYVARVTRGAEALRRMRVLPAFDVVLLDLRLPDKTGFEVLREARHAGVDSPVIVVTACASQKERLRGFELGADDYVVKPFDLEVLAARVRAAIRRTHKTRAEPKDVYTIDDAVVDLDHYTMRRNGDEVELTELEGKLLGYFLSHRGRTVTRKQLLRDVWGISGDVTTRTIDRHVASLRKKIATCLEDPERIETVYGVGYKFLV